MPKHPYIYSLYTSVSTSVNYKHHTFNSSPTFSMQVMQFSLIIVDLSVCLTKQNKTKKNLFVPSCQSHTLILVLDGG